MPGGWLLPDTEPRWRSCLFGVFPSGQNSPGRLCLPSSAVEGLRRGAVSVCQLHEVKGGWSSFTSFRATLRANLILCGGSSVYLPLCNARCPLLQMMQLRPERKVAFLRSPLLTAGEWQS